MSYLFIELNCQMPLTASIWKDCVSEAASNWHGCNLNASAKYLWKSPKVLAIVISAFWRNMLESAFLDFGKPAQSCVFSHACLITEVLCTCYLFHDIPSLVAPGKPQVIILCNCMGNG